MLNNGEMTEEDLKNITLGMKNVEIVLPCVETGNEHLVPFDYLLEFDPSNPAPIILHADSDKWNPNKAKLYLRFEETQLGHYAADIALVLGNDDLYMGRIPGHKFADLDDKTEAATILLLVIWYYLACRSSMKSRDDIRFNLNSFDLLIKENLETTISHATTTISAWLLGEHLHNDFIHQVGGTSFLDIQAYFSRAWASR